MITCLDPLDFFGPGLILYSFCSVVGSNMSMLLWMITGSFILMECLSLQISLFHEAIPWSLSLWEIMVIVTCASQECWSEGPSLVLSVSKIIMSWFPTLNLLVPPRLVLLSLQALLWAADLEVQLGSFLDPSLVFDIWGEWIFSDHNCMILSSLWGYAAANNSGKKLWPPATVYWSISWDLLGLKILSFTVLLFSSIIGFWTSFLWYLCLKKDFV